MQRITIVTFSENSAAEGNSNRSKLPEVCICAILKINFKIVSLLIFLGL